MKPALNAAQHPQTPFAIILPRVLDTVLTPLYVKTRVQAASVPYWRMRKSVITRW